MRNNNKKILFFLSGLLSIVICFILGNDSKTDHATHVPVFMYHSIVPRAFNTDPENTCIMDLEAFEKGIKFLSQQGYYTATLRELEDYIHRRKSLPPNTVVLTFDDGYQNNVKYAYPILKKYGFKANMFVIGKRSKAHTVKFDPKQLSYISKQEMKETGDVFEFHSHTYNLHYKKQVNGKKITAGLDPTVSHEEDIIKMKQKTGIDTPYFCYPYGDYNDEMIRVLQKHGYRMAFTVHSGSVRPGDDLMRLARLDVTSKTNMKQLLRLAKKI